MAQLKDTVIAGNLRVTDSVIADSVETESQKVNGAITIYNEGTTEEDAAASLVFSVKDTTTGNTYGSTYIKAFQDHGASTAGLNMVIRPGGNLFLGGGESASGHYALMQGSTTENTYIDGDTYVFVQSTAGTIANRKGFVVNAGNILPVVADTLTDSQGTIGNSSYKWDAVYANTLYGVLTGSCSYAQLTNEDLDTITPDEATLYYAAGSNSVTNSPLTNGRAFAMAVVRISTTYKAQILASPDNTWYMRRYTTSWGDWVQMKFTDTTYTATTTSIGSASTGTAIPADDITAWSAGTLPTASVANGILTLSMGSLPSLSYTAKSIPNISVTSKTVATGITAS